MNEPDIDHLLRQQAPEIPVRPGLESRIHAALRQRPRRRFSLLWLALPATALIALVLVLSRPEPPAPAEVVISLPQLPDQTEPALALNPLGNEAEAIRYDAERTGRFLLDCLPSLSVAER